MSEVLIKNTTVLTMNEDNEIIREGDILIENGEISEIGEEIEKDAEKEIDGEGKVAMPGLVNAHTHISMSLFRGVADDLDLQTWLEEKIWPMEANLDGEDVKVGALLSCLEMIKSGTTCFADLYFFMDEVANVVEKSGMRASLAYGIIEENDPEKREEEIGAGEELVKNYEGYADGRITTMFGPHSTYTCSPTCLEEVFEFAEEYDVGMHIHLAENSKEIEDVTGMHGERPVELLDSLNILNSRVLAAHCTHLTEEEIEIINENGVIPVHNPVSNMKLGSGIAPVPELLEKGVDVALGTDGAASNNSLDMFEEMKFAALLNKARMEDATVVTAREVLKMATINGAKGLGLEDKIGSLEVGKCGDLILVDMENPHTKPLFNVESQLVYSCSGNDVETVIVDGKVLMEEGKVLTLESDEILKEAQKHGEELAGDVI